MNGHDAKLGQSHSLIGDDQTFTIDDIGPSFEYDPELPKLNKFSVSVKSKTNGPNVSTLIIIISLEENYQ